MSDKLLFPADRCTVDRHRIETPDGAHEIEFREYRMVPYCARPIHLDYHSMDVFVPVRVDGAAVDVSDAPIYLCNNVQGYHSWNIRTREPGRSGPDGPRPGPGARPPRGEDARSPRYGRDYWSDYALLRGFVVVKPGTRGRDCRREDGSYFGKAPASVVDLKAAVRYMRHNRDRFPGNVEKIFSKGASAGGSISAVLGASANSDAYAPYLEAIGAADERDDVLGAVCFCPITDLGHADMAYEWMFGERADREGKLADQRLSAELRALYADYLERLNLEGRGGFGPLRADNLGDYLTREFLHKSAREYLLELGEGERAEYLAKNDWIGWDGRDARFGFDDLVAQVARMKGLCSFDGRGEMSLFGDERVDARHFTRFGAGLETPGAEVEPEVQRLVDLMNPMRFIQDGNPACAEHWWICVGTRDAHTSLSISCALATLLENRGKAVDLRYLWDFGHAVEDDPAPLMDWMLETARRAG